MVNGAWLQKTRPGLSYIVQYAKDALNVGGCTGGGVTDHRKAPAGGGLIAGEIFIAASPSGQRLQRRVRPPGEDFPLSMPVPVAGRSVVDSETREIGVPR